MPRKVRCYAPGITCHIVQRGNNRQTCFLSNDDFGFYIQVLSEALKRYRVALHAFVLMTNHVHLLMTPSDSIGISRVMQLVGRRYVRYFNSLHQRTGTLWEGRHRASLIDSVEYLLVCQKYIEMNPVRAGMAEHPGQYHWSSYRANALGQKIECLTEHPEFTRLGQSPAQRHCRYRELFLLPALNKDLHKIRQCLQHNYPLGNTAFREQIETRLNVHFGALLPGRPCTSETDPA
ncbi:transposase [Lacimicrobium alkaliphilum]|uniref:transposase n=1 Tax=Lacimicrobium alkaliphilum TaxID=1526571 RepID=UPI000BFEC944|nr:transposase [Lacimicrobium alkaliphilum]